MVLNGCKNGWWEGHISFICLYIYIYVCICLYIHILYSVEILWDAWVTHNKPLQYFIWVYFIINILSLIMLSNRWVFTGFSSMDHTKPQPQHQDPEHASWTAGSHWPLPMLFLVILCHVIFMSWYVLSLLIPLPDWNSEFVYHLPQCWPYIYSCGQHHYIVPCQDAHLCYLLLLAI